MRDDCRAIRAELRRMPTKDAAAMIASFRLPQEEDAAVYLMDVGKLSAIQAAERMGVSPETVKRRRASAYARMAAEIAQNGPG